VLGARTARRAVLPNVDSARTTQHSGANNLAPASLFSFLVGAFFVLPRPPSSSPAQHSLHVSPPPTTLGSCACWTRECRYKVIISSRDQDTASFARFRHNHYPRRACRTFGFPGYGCSPSALSHPSTRRQSCTTITKIARLIATTSLARLVSKHHPSI
jgi:hypothetical protein